MLKVILDTNFLFIPFTLGIDIFSEIEKILFEPYTLYVVEGTVQELEKIRQEQKGKHVQVAKAALNLVEKCAVLKQKDLNRNIDSVDDIIVHVADDKTVVATQDRELKRRLKAKGIRIITTRGKQLHVLQN